MAGEHSTTEPPMLTLKRNYLYIRLILFKRRKFFSSSPILNTDDKQCAVGINTILAYSKVILVGRWKLQLAQVIPLNFLASVQLSSIV